MKINYNDMNEMIHTYWRWNYQDVTYNKEKRLETNFIATLIFDSTFTNYGIKWKRFFMWTLKIKCIEQNHSKLNKCVPCPSTSLKIKIKGV